MKIFRHCMTIPSVVFALLSAGCGQDAQSWETYSAREQGDASDSAADTLCPVGTGGCPCNDDGACISPLTCLQGICSGETEDTGSPDDEGGPNCDYSCVSFDECSARGIPILGGTCADTEEVCCNVASGDIAETDCGETCLTLNVCLAQDGTLITDGTCSDDREVCCEVAAVTGNTTDCDFSCTTTQVCFAENGTVDFDGICPEFEDVCCDLATDAVVDEDPWCQYTCMTGQACFSQWGTMDFSGWCAGGGEVCCDVGAGGESTCAYTCLGMQECYARFGFIDFGGTCSAAGEFCCNTTGWWG